MSRDIWIIGLAILTWGFGEGMFSFFQPLYLQKLGADPVSIGAILGGMGIAMAVAHIPAGYISDRIGRRPVVWASWIMGMLAGWVMALATSLPVFVAGLLMFGFTFFAISSINSYITAARGSLSVGRALTLVSVFFNIGTILGPLAGGWISDHYSLQRAYQSGASMFIISTLIILFLRHQPVEKHDPAAKESTTGLSAQYWRYLAIIFLAVLATYLPQPLSPNYLQNQQGFSFSQIGQLGSISSLGVVILSLVLGQMPAKRGFILGQVSVGLFALLFWLGKTWAWFAVGYFLIGGYRPMRALAAAQVRPMVPASRIGLAYGVMETVSAAAVFCAPPLAGLLYRQQPVMMYNVSIGLIVVSIMVGVFFLPRRHGSLERE